MRDLKVRLPTPYESLSARLMDPDEPSGSSTRVFKTKINGTTLFIKAFNDESNDESTAGGEDSGILRLAVEALATAIASHLSTMIPSVTIPEPLVLGSHYVDGEATPVLCLATKADETLKGGNLDGYSLTLIEREALAGCAVLRFLLGDIDVSVENALPCVSAKGRDRLPLCLIDFGMAFTDQMPKTAKNTLENERSFEDIWGNMTAVSVFVMLINNLPVIGSQTESVNLWQQSTNSFSLDAIAKSTMDVIAKLINTERSKLERIHEATLQKLSEHFPSKKSSLYVDTLNSALQQFNSRLSLLEDIFANRDSKDFLDDVKCALEKTLEIFNSDSHGPSVHNDSGLAKKIGSQVTALRLVSSVARVCSSDAPHDAAIKSRPPTIIADERVAIEYPELIARNMSQINEWAIAGDYGQKIIGGITFVLEASSNRPDSDAIVTIKISETPMAGVMGTSGPSQNKPQGFCDSFFLDISGVTEANKQLGSDRTALSQFRRELRCALNKDQCLCDGIWQSQSVSMGTALFTCLPSAKFTAYNEYVEINLQVNYPKKIISILSISSVQCIDDNRTGTLNRSIPIDRPSPTSPSSAFSAAKASVFSPNADELQVSGPKGCFRPIKTI